MDAASVEETARLARARPGARGDAVATLGPGAAVAGWVAVIVALNLTSHPLVAGATFAGLCVLALRTGHLRLVVLALSVGVGLLLVVPGVSQVDGSFALTYRSGSWSMPHGAGDWTLALASSLRIPAQVLAAVLLALVPAPLLLAAARRLSPRTALLGGIAARTRPLLARDLRLMRDELASRGLRITRGAPVSERARGIVALWEAMISGLLDRAFQTAAALETRGFGAHGVPTTAPLEHPELHDGVRRSATRDRLVVAAAALLVLTVLAARTTGTLAPTANEVFGGLHEPIGPAVIAATALALLVGLLPMVPTPTALPRVRRHVAMPATPSPALELRVEAASMHYPSSSTPALHGASMHVAPGELVVATGASGSGKSTLLDIITGVAPRATGGTRGGRIRLGEHVLGGVRGGADARIAAVFQDPESQVLVGQVAEEVAFCLRHAGLPIREIESRVLDVLDRLAIRHLAQRDCATLSGGELQRVLLAAALALEPALLVLDEPTSQVDAGSERRFWDAVDVARHERGVGVLVAEHRLDHVLDRADRVLAFDGGRIVADVPASQLAAVAPHLLADAYAGLAPNPVAVGAGSRLVVQLDRLEVAPEAMHGRTLLRGLAFAVPARAIVTLEGPNGTGKSTLLRAIRGLHPTRGGVQVDGRDRGDVGASVDRVAFLSQGAGALLPGRSVRHAIEDTCRRLGIDVAAAHVALAAAGLADRIDDHPGELSVGERQRLALVAATAHRPAVWLLDEPTRGMDAAARRWVACHVLAHAAAGGVVLVATHDPALAAAIATHRLRLDLRTGPSLLVVSRDSSGAVMLDSPFAAPWGTEEVQP
jgi:energy-coupling factor transport system ATP-binding protein